MKKFTLLLFSIFSAGLISCGGNGTEREIREVPNISLTPREVVVVSIEGEFFNPPQISINPGMKVRWENNDSIVHTVTSGREPQIIFDSGAIPPGNSFEFTFNTEDSFEYYSRANEATTRGIIVVREGAADRHE
jgi:manganese oxidase